MLSTAAAFTATGPRRTRVCILGAGAAGITLACELDGSGIDVVLLDGGSRHGWMHTKERQRRRIRR